MFPGGCRIGCWGPGLADVQRDGDQSRTHDHLDGRRGCLAFRLLQRQEGGKAFPSDDEPGGLTLCDQ